MTFSLAVKNELARIFDKNKCCNLAELSALIKSSSSIQITGGSFKLTFVTANAAVARKVIKFLKVLFEIQSNVMYFKRRCFKKKNFYVLRILEHSSVLNLLVKLGIWDNNINLPVVDITKVLNRDCCFKAYLRGVFLASGSINDPKSGYHMEIVVNNTKYAKSILNLMDKLGVDAKTCMRKNKSIIYLKDSERIVKVLSIMGAHSALLDFENARIYKSVRGQVNRLVNCETANLNKTVNAAVRQVENIRYIADTIGLDNLTPALKEAAELRLNYPDVGLKELGELLDPPISKSGINHRMRKLEEIASSLKNKEFKS